MDEDDMRSGPSGSAYGRRDAPVYSEGVRRSDGSGRERCGIDEEEVFISRQTERAMTNEGDSILVRATDGRFVVQPDTSKDASEGGDADTSEDDPWKRFANVRRMRRASEVRGRIGIVRDGRIIPRVGDEDRRNGDSAPESRPGIFRTRRIRAGLLELRTHQKIN